MVNTRNRTGPDESPGRQFVSLRGKTNKDDPHSDPEDSEDQSSDEEVTSKSKRQRVAIKRQTSQSPNSSTPLEIPRKPRARLLDETPITASSVSPRRTRSAKRSGSKFRRGQTIEDLKVEEDDDEHDETYSASRSPRQKRLPSRYREDDEDVMRATPKSGKKSKVIRRYQDDDDDDEDNFRVAPRRTSRERKLVYSTMNQSLIAGNCRVYSTDLLLSGGADVSPPVSSSRRKKKQQEEEEDDEDDDEDEDDESNKGSVDMYSRIKNRRISEEKAREEERERQRLIEEEAEEEEEDSDDSDEDEEEETSSEEESSEEETSRKNYSLRRQRRPPDRFEAAIHEPIPRQALKDSLFDQALSPLRRRFKSHSRNLTPIRSPHFSRRSRFHASHQSSSTSSGSDDERGFERRKKKSMAKARMRCLPMNLKPEDVATGERKDRQRIGSSLADVDPMTIDTNVTFESVGGLGRHVQKLKEMVVFPLLYPEVFERFKITPPRGVLFHGPPGTGKTLVARALANECRLGDKRVAFFMRKGADCLSKWVGESERQLRLLFDQAFQMRPAIIFFDEIDGLAPVRSSRQDQIHSSIVSTLLALMDGLDSRGEVVVIGATNRIDSIDPALRRPGRFDREFLFPLPSCKARESILTIHTKEWTPKLSETFISEIAEKCVGYCGADMKALCTEAGLSALRHQYPQIYASKEKLQLDLNRIRISARDFQSAMQTIVPAAQRAVVSPGRSLSYVIKPLLQNQFENALEVVKRLLPAALYSTSQHEGHSDTKTDNMVLDMLNEDDFSEDEEDDNQCIFANQPKGHRRRILSETEGHNSSRPFINFTCAAYNKPTTHRPRLLIAGDKGKGQSSHLAPAILHYLERLPVHCLDLAALYAVSAKSPEESCAHIFREARRASPSIIYMPHICQWWDASGETTRATFLTLLQDLPPTAPILILATSDCPTREIPEDIRFLFGSYYGEVITMRSPNAEEKREFFADLILVQAAKAPIRKKRAAAVALQVLEPAPLPKPVTLSKNEEKLLQDKEEKTLRELRLFLRDVLSRLATEKKFRVFAKPVDPEEVPDYGEVVKQPMDLSTMMNKINMHKYTKARQFLDDIDLITSNALEYNPDRHPEDRIIRNRACELKDSAYAIVQTEMESEFEKLCVEIEESRAKRGDSPAKTAPAFYRVQPQQGSPSKASPSAGSHHVNGTYPSRYSRRALGMESEHLSAAEEAMLYASCRPLERKKPKKRKLKSRWSRGFVPNLKKKKLKAIDEDDDDDDKKDDADDVEKDTAENEENDQDNEENDQENEENDQENEANDQENEETDNENDEEKPSVVENGVMDNDEDEHNGDVLEDLVDSICNDVKSQYSATVNNQCSDDDSVKSGEVNPRRLTRRSYGRLPASHRSPVGRMGRRSRGGSPRGGGDRSQGNSPRVSERSSRGNSPRVNDKSPRDGSRKITDNPSVALSNLDNEDDASTSAQTSSLDPPSLPDQEMTQELQDGEEESKMETDAVTADAVEEQGETSEKNKQGEEEEKDEDQEQRERRMVTRRMIADKEAERAREILEASIPKLVVDRTKLEALLDQVVVQTCNFNIERLERLHCSFSQCIYQHRRDYDKSQLIMDMEAELARAIKL